MNKFKKILVLTLLISLPINIFGFIWLYKTLKTYHFLDEFVVSFDKNFRFYKIGTSEFDDLKQRVSSLIGVNEISGAQLLINEKSINELNSNLPLSGTISQGDSFLQIDGTILKGKSRLRGDHVYHWGLSEKSWRFKTSKKHVYKGINKFNFIILKTNDLLSNHITYRLAESLGILAPYSQLVDFNINGVYRGPRIMVEQIDESFLRKNRRMPNDIYKGDNIGQKQYYGVDVSLFNNASIWAKASYNNHYQANSHLPLTEVLKGISKGNHDLINLKNFAAFSALIDLASTYHHDQTHNWILYFDHYYEKMYPIVWDSTGWVEGTVNEDNLNIITSDLLESLYTNYQFLREKYDVLYEFYTISKTEFINDLNKGIKDSKRIIKQNNSTQGIDRNKVKGQEALAYVDTFEKYVVSKLNQNQEHFLGDALERDYKYSFLNNDTVRISIDGSKLVNTVKIKLIIPKLISAGNIYYSKNKMKYEQNIADLITMDGNELNIGIKLLANSKQAETFSRTRLDYFPATYDFMIDGLDTNNIEKISLSFQNISNQSLDIKNVEIIEPQSFNENIQNIISMPITETLTWSGEKHFSGFNLVEENINIQPGTKLLFEEGATLKVLGKVMAIGTADEPIIFDAVDSSKPWGAFALKDERANDSVFKHVIFKNGSGDKGDLYEYTAMFSVHNVKNLLVEDSEFYDSKLTDDMVHIIYSDVKLKDSKFVRSLSDAVDIDISTAVIENCEFINSGNDSIDLMTSDAVVINSVFRNSQDKGISIGEGSNLLAINNLIENSLIGMQSKDTSLAYIYNTSFIGNDKAIDAYHKNWRYSEGGSIYVDKCLMQQNKENATVGKKSKVVVNDCQIDSKDNFDAKEVRKAKIILSDEDFIPATFTQDLFQSYSDLIQKQTQGSYQ